MDKLIPWAAIALATYPMMLLWTLEKHRPAIAAAFAQVFLLPVAAATWPVGKMLEAVCHLLRPVNYRFEYYLLRRSYQGRHFA